MNRKILFRGLRLDTKEWVYGYYYQHDPPLHCFAGEEKDKPEAYILKTGFADWNMTRPMEQHLVDIQTVGALIGIVDKNKTQIYEGDIGEIRTQSGRIERFTVEWGIHRREMKSGWTVDIPAFAFIVDGKPTFPIVENYQNGHDLDIITVIGNIHESPNLLKQINE